MFPEETLVTIRRGWALAASTPGETAQAFYAHLFAMDPDTEQLFRGDMKVQGRKLTDTLDFIVDSLDVPEDLLPAARDLAQRHVNYGVTPEHYSVVGQALIAALRDRIGGGFGEEDEAAWTNVYTTLAGAMIESGYGA